MPQYGGFLTSRFLAGSILEATLQEAMGRDLRLESSWPEPSDRLTSSIQRCHK
jgi:hypothetical protein